MALYVVRRVLWTIPILLVALTIAFVMMRAIGGDPFRHGPLLGNGHPNWVKYGDPQPESIRQNLRRKYGLDLPWYEQYGNYLLGVATWEFGPSHTYRERTVNGILRSHAPVSALLGLLAFAIAAGVGIPLGILAALRAGSPADHALRLLTLAGLAVPVFVVATLLIAVVSLRLGWLPTSGWGGGWRPKVLPSVSLSLLPLAYLLQLTRAAVLATLDEEYVLAARAKGLRRRALVARHVVRNALVPVLNAAGPMLGVLVTGSFVVEDVFGVPGLGRYFVSAVAARDLPVVMGITVLLTLAVVVANLLVDVANALLDPRSRGGR